MNAKNTQSNKRMLGWFLALVMPLTMLSSSAWALDLDHEVSRQEAEAAQVLSTLGRGRAVSAATSADTEARVKVQLLHKHAPKARKRR